MAKLEKLMHLPNLRIKVDPFLYCVEENFFAPEIYNSIKQEYDSTLALGLSESYSSEKFWKFSHYDAYCYIPKQDNEGVRSFFYSREWKNLVATSFSREDLSDDVLLEYHYHRPNGKEGEIHSDDERVYFQEFTGNHLGDYLRSFDCSVPYRDYTEKAIPRRRAIVAILYLNDGWKIEDGGQTAIYRNANDKEPSVLVEPKGNTILLFEIGPESWHHSLALGNKERKNICFWFHS